MRAMIKRGLEMVEDARHRIGRHKRARVQNSEPPCTPSLLDQQPNTPSDEELLHTSNLFEQQPNPTYEEPPHDHPHQHLDPSNNEERQHLPHRWSLTPLDDEPDEEPPPLSDCWSPPPPENHADEELPRRSDHQSQTPPEEHPAESPTPSEDQPDEEPPQMAGCRSLTPSEDQPDKEPLCTPSPMPPGGFNIEYQCRQRPVIDIAALAETANLPLMHRTMDFILALKTASLDDPAAQLTDNARKRLRNPPGHVISIEDWGTRFSISTYLALENSSQAAYNHVCKAAKRDFSDSHCIDTLLTFHNVEKIIALYTGVVSIEHDMCRNSCLVYTGSDHPDINVFKLPPGGCAEYANHLWTIVSMSNQTQWDRQKTKTGLTKPPLILALPPTQSLGVPLCMTTDIMHLAGNISDLLISLWHGTLDHAADNDPANWPWAVLSDEDIWYAHGKAVECTGRHLPSSYDCKPCNIAKKINTQYKTWEFQLYIFSLAPILLYNVLPMEYWANYCKLVHRFQIMCQSALSKEKLLDAHALLCSWEHEFELIYYRLQESRIHFIRPCMHQVIHLVSEAIFKGPPICYAQWTMQRTIGNLGEQIRQPSKPFANLSHTGLPYGSVDLGDGYVLLRKCAKHPIIPCGDEAMAILDFLDHGYALPRITKWAWLRLPNGQIARSAWREKLHLPDQIHVSCNVKFFSQGTTQCGEVQFFTRLAVGDNEHAEFIDVTIVCMYSTLYSTPDAKLLQLLHHVVLASQLTDTISVILVKQITGVIAMIPQQMVLPLGVEQEVYCLMEQPGNPFDQLASSVKSPLGASTPNGDSSPQEMNTLDEWPTHGSHEKVQFWTKKDYNDWMDSPEAQNSNHGLYAYMEEENGKVLDSEKLGNMQKALQAAWADLTQRNLAPDTWGKASTTAQNFVHSTMERTYPLLKLAEDCKLKKNGHNVKEEASDDEDLEDHKPIAKKQKGQGSSRSSAKKPKVEDSPVTEATTFMLGQLPSPSLSTSHLSGTPESPVDDMTMHIDVDMEATVQPTDPEHSAFQPTETSTLRALATKANTEQPSPPSDSNENSRIANNTTGHVSYDPMGLLATAPEKVKIGAVPPVLDPLKTPHAAPSHILDMYSTNMAQNDGLLGSSTTDMTAKSKTKLQPSSTKNGWNLCMLQWLKQVNANGQKDDFHAYYDHALTPTQQKSYNKEAKQLVETNSWSKAVIENGILY
ncbi:hypothetical protein SCLCIDRAFT_29257 [Scleroderma citrinum Foug A]|uniref:Uncharacterized protein n=1 Tax=Scleroderma citrinum Foug A TaxID=1036808 RepID=A0A0C2Z4G5_9AGAM|nr:hypothetical protein SCLCIDRAFT_29257 [Scleroderma citrinum Foug A]